MLRRVLTNPEVHVALKTYPRKTNEVFALSRMNDNIACIELTLASLDTNKSISNQVLRTILGSICYNVSLLSYGLQVLFNALKFLAAEFTQAKLHLEGTKMMIERRGGIDSLAADNQLRLMLFWYV